MTPSEAVDAKERRREYQRQWHLSNKDRQNQRSRDWAKSNADRHAELVRQWERANPEKRLAKQRASYHRRKTEDPRFILRLNFTRAIRHSLKGGKAGRKWESLVGYTRDDLAAHLERQFVKGMSWENMGEWHIDHIVPLSSFSFTSTDDPEFRRAWSLPNLRPLWGADNLRKSDKRETLL